MPEYSEVEQEQVRRAHENYVLPDKKEVDEKYTVNKDGEVVNNLDGGEDFDPDTVVRTVEDTAPFHEVKATNDARMAHAGEDHERVTNAELSTHPASDELQVVVTGNRAGVDANPEDTQGVEDLEMEALVRRAAEAGKLYETGGPMGNYTGEESLSPYVDGAWLAERSKQTGEKHF